MRLSSGVVVSGLVGLPVAEDGVEDVDAAAGQGQHGLVVCLPSVRLRR